MESSPTDRVPMHQAEALCEWLVPGRGVQVLTYAINMGDLLVFARRAPPTTGATITETRDDGTEATPDWADRWTAGPLVPPQVAFARAVANFPHSGWERWFDQLVQVDADELAEFLDRVVELVPRRGADRRWTALDVFAWIALAQLPDIDHGADAPSFDADLWQFAGRASPLAALIWRIERGNGTWRTLPDGDAPAARAAFNALHAALWPAVDGLKVAMKRSGQGGWTDAPPAAFAGAVFDPGTPTLDLAPGDVLVFDADSVRIRWPIDGARQPGRTDRAAEPAPFSDAERRAWIENTPVRNCDEAHRLFKADPRWDGTKQAQFRQEWAALRGAQRGRPRKS